MIIFKKQPHIKARRNCKENIQNKRRKLRLQKLVGELRLPDGRIKKYTEKIIKICPVKSFKQSKNKNDDCTTYKI